jgi:hypothetical protein
MDATLTASFAGHGAHAEAMMTVGVPWAAAMQSEGFFGRDPETCSAPGAMTYATRAETLQPEKKTIVPPPFVAGWRQTQVELLGLARSLGRAIASDAFFARLTWADQLDKDDAPRPPQVPSPNGNEVELTGIDSFWPPTAARSADAAERSTMRRGRQRATDEARRPSVESSILDASV